MTKEMFFLCLQLRTRRNKSCDLNVQSTKSADNVSKSIESVVDENDNVYVSVEYIY